MIGYYGNIKFEITEQYIRTFKDFTGGQSAAYKVHDVLDGKQKLQFTGQNLQTRSLTIRLASDTAPPQGKGTRKEIRALSGMVNSGRAWPLVLGNTSYGRFVLEGLTEEETRFDGHGDMTAAKMTLTLREYN